MQEIRDANGLTEAEFLQQYDENRYPKPSLTADVVIFRTDEDSSHCDILLIRRKNHPCIGQLALPGGFADEGETIEQTAARELEEETGIRDLSLTLVGIYSTPGRDPRGWTVSAAYTILLPEGTIEACAGDDAAEVCWVEVRTGENGTEVCLPDGGRPAFDHAQIISDAVQCLPEKEFATGKRPADA